MKAVFLDKDGTIVKDVPYNVDPHFIMLETFVLEGLRLLQEEYKLVIVSNQSGLAKGKFGIDELTDYWLSLISLLREESVSVAAYYFCPHHPEGAVEEYREICDCRKPAPGMILRAARDLQINLSESWMIGDILDDVEAGHRAGCRSVLINNGNETEWKEGRGRIPDFVAVHFAQAADYILKKGQKHYEPLARY